MSRFYVALVVLGLLSCNTKSGNSFTVDGVIKNSQAKYVYLEQNLANQERPLVLDSSQVGSDGKFHLTTTTKEEGIFSLRAGNAGLPFAVLINDSKKVSISADLSRTSDAYTVTGSAASQELVDFDKMVGQKLQLLTQYAQHYDSVVHIKTDMSNQGQVDSLRVADSTGYESVAREMKDYVTALSEKNNSPSLITYAVTTFQQIAERYGLSGFTPTEVSEIVNKAISRFPDNTTLQDWKKTLRPGKAPDFTMQDTSGRAVSLSSFKGKYLLVDFWASWCRPCRMENPNVVAAYKQFRDKNFTILSVSLDTSRQSWMTAIHNDGLTWNHVSDLKGWDSQTAVAYGVQGIPYNFLLDPDGNIIAEDIRGPELFNALGRYLK